MKSVGKRNDSIISASGITPITARIENMEVDIN